MKDLANFKRFDLAGTGMLEFFKINFNRAKRHLTRAFKLPFEANSLNNFVRVLLTVVLFGGRLGSSTQFKKLVQQALEEYIY